MYRSPFKITSRETCSFKKKGSWAAGYHTGVDRVCSNVSLVSPAAPFTLKSILPLLSLFKSLNNAFAELI